MAIELKDLSDKVLKQALAKIKEQEERKLNKQIDSAIEQVKKDKTSKWRNVKTDVGAITFDSKKEAIRYRELMAMLSLGEISDLRLQETFVLQRPYTTPEGERIRAISYQADFTYTVCKTGERIVEDVKGRQTQTYRTKKKMMMSVLGIKILET